MNRRVALALTALTGFSGLVYEVAWQKYLASLLGSHSEATAAVLALFLGGLSIGYGLFGRVSRRAEGSSPGRLLTIYGVVEAAIGVLAITFPLAFRAVQAFSLWLPVASPGFGFAIDVFLCALLIGPASILMGGTIPLLTQALAHDVEDATRFHALVYGFNTAGAFIGALAASFFVIPAVGLAGTVLWMGSLNLFAGASFMLLGQRVPEDERIVESQAPADDASAAIDARLVAALGVTALLAGFAMMSLQTTLNRLGALALGASHHTFSMIVATFVLCIAIGSFCVARARDIRARHLVLTQWALVGYLTLAYGLMPEAPYWAHRLRVVFSSYDASFLPYQISVFVLLLAVLVVPLALSGALLPLLFHDLRRRAVDLGAVAGKLYSWNTVGSLLGALLGGYVLLFVLDLHHIYRLAVLALALAAGLLTATVLPNRRPLAIALVLVTALTLASLPKWDSRQLFAGVFRAREALPHSFAGPDVFFAERAREYPSPDFVLFHDDDPTMSVGVLMSEGDARGPGRALFNNGKSDGAVPSDNATTGLLALLPALLADHVTSAFVIGYGTGMTVGELAALDEMREVVVAEISSGVMKAAPHFESLIRPAVSSPKTTIIQSDAYRALMRDERRYDVIVSEPSNPWTTGVEMLYSVEFLRAAHGRLAPGGVYAQWFHLYETDTQSVELVLNSYRQVFERVAVWFGGPGDLVILGFEDVDAEPGLARIMERVQRPDYQRQLRDIGIASLPALLAHEIIPVGAVHAADLGEEVHTIAHPRLSHVAARAFFVGETAGLPRLIDRRAASIAAHNSLVRRFAKGYGGRLPDPLRAVVVEETCRLDIGACAALLAEWQREAPDSPRLAATLSGLRGAGRDNDELAAPNLAGLSRLFDPALMSSASHTYATASRATRIFGENYHHAAPFDGRTLANIWSRCRGDERCRDGFERNKEVGVVRSASAPQTGQYAPAGPRSVASHAP